MVPNHSPTSELNRVAICLAVYRPDLAFLKEQIESIQHQTHSEWKCLISNDGASVEVQNYLEELAQSDPRFQVTHQQQNLGVVGNFNFLIQSVPSDVGWVALSDQDDIWNPKKLQRLLEVGNQHRDVVLLHHDLRLISGEGLEISPSCWISEDRDPQPKDVFQVLFRNPVTGCASFLRREWLRQIPPIPHQEGSVSYYHDQWLAIQALKFGKILALNEVLVDYRQHSSNLVGGGDKKGRGLQIQTLKIFSKNLKRLEFDAGFRLKVWHVIREFPAAIAQLLSGKTSRLRRCLLVSARWMV